LNFSLQFIEDLELHVIKGECFTILAESRTLNNRWKTLMPIQMIWAKNFGLCLMPSGQNQPNFEKCLMDCPDVHCVIVAQPDVLSRWDSLVVEVVSCYDVMLVTGSNSTCLFG
jgi:hypothetical protein